MSIESLEKKTSIRVAVCALVLLAGIETSAQQQDTSSNASAERDTPDTIACAQESGETLGWCSYLIKNDGEGNITVTVVFENGFKRGLLFKNGAFLKGSVTMSGTGTDIDWRLQDGNHMIRVDDQRYIVPDSLITAQ